MTGREKDLQVLYARLGKLRVAQANMGSEEASLIDAIQKMEYPQPRRNHTKP